MVALRGLAWDHRRCWGPLEASIEPYRAAHPGIAIAWDRQSLHDFGEGNLEAALRAYDLVIFDHPYIGDIARDGLMVPFDTLLGEAGLARFAADSAGASWRSYRAEGRHWALPIDAACQVAAYRPDLLAPYGAPPRSPAELLALARRLRADGRWIGLPLKPTDAMCLVLTLAAADGLADGAFPGREAVMDAVAALRELAALAHPLSPGWNPIACYEHMVAHDDVVYAPYAFGYVTYAARSEGPRLAFADIPASPPRGAILGGAGIGVSAVSSHPREAMAYALYLCSPDYQKGDYVRAGGQPGSLGAWTDAGADALTQGFFRDTLATLRGAWLRPTHPGFIGFFREATHQAAAAIAGRIGAEAFADWIEERYRASRPEPILQGSAP
ncbi:extracellular solute-binding protein [Labrys wisconsinensis]|uniref:sn-glycerol-3-phosphate-binding periplasmic protein UgpB n=1 Tax=Labrys wisconsinensis TaxID=425677 RepID=A0ABU0JIJ8_9HYPH|nr:extracellular solute-binding protein [Labrys wisconsinensis]MDQ0474110.1 multiple sugar transport system substrate-binding protein [Labrys wisconsinensis]